MPDLIVKELYFKDGEYPTNEIINEYSAFIIECKKKFTRPIIAIHCVSSLGRAPCIIALQMIQEGNKDRFYIIEYIRSNIRGAFNIKQLNWVLDFKLKSKSVLSSFFKCF
jgi:protein-tyrosine phosphatase